MSGQLSLWKASGWTLLAQPLPYALCIAGFGFTCHPFLRAGVIVGQRIPAGAINMKVSDDWEHLERCEGAGQLELEP